MLKSLRRHIYIFLITLELLGKAYRACHRIYLIMAPVFRREVICPIAFNTSTIDRSAAEINTQTNGIRSRDEEALLYIVVTLLFYSLGIIVGIVTYLKQEKEEIEENKMFDEFIAFNKGQSVLNNVKDRQILVQKTIGRLKELEIKSLNRSRYNSLDLAGTSQSSFGSTPKHFRYHLVHMDKDFTGGAHFHSSDYEISDLEEDPFPNRRLSQVVAKILESETDIEPMDEQHTPITDQSENQSETMQPTEIGDLATDFIEYNEEPKNKALLRGLEKQNVQPTKQEDDTKHNVHVAETSVYDAKAIDPVYESSKRRQSLLEKFAHNDLESIEEESDSPTYKWSVTSV